MSEVQVHEGDGVAVRYPKPIFHQPSQHWKACRFLSWTLQDLNRHGGYIIGFILVDFLPILGVKPKIIVNKRYNQIKWSLYADSLTLKLKGVKLTNRLEIVKDFNSAFYDPKAEPKYYRGTFSYEGGWTEDRGDRRSLGEQKGLFDPTKIINSVVDVGEG